MDILSKRGLREGYSPRPYCPVNVAFTSSRAYNVSCQEPAGTKRLTLRTGFQPMRFPGITGHSSTLLWTLPIYQFGSVRIERSRLPLESFTSFTLPENRARTFKLGNVPVRTEIRSFLRSYAAMLTRSPWYGTYRRRNEPSSGLPPLFFISPSSFHISQRNKR